MKRWAWCTIRSQSMKAFTMRRIGSTARGSDSVKLARVARVEWGGCAKTAVLLSCEPHKMGEIQGFPFFRYHTTWYRNSWHGSNLTSTIPSWKVPDGIYPEARGVKWTGEKRMHYRLNESCSCALPNARNAIRTRKRLSVQDPSVHESGYRHLSPS